MVPVWVIAPRSGIEPKDRSGTGLDDSSPSLGWRMLRLIHDDHGFVREIDRLMRASNFDAGDIHTRSDQSISCLLAGLAGGSDPSKVKVSELRTVVFDDG